MNDSENETEFVPGEPPPDGCCCWLLWDSLTAAGQRGLAVVFELSTVSHRSRFCAWCGKHLHDVFAAASSEFTRFAETHREFIPPAP